MKRSEAIRHLINVINREAHYGLTAEELAKEILVEIELIGMLPPRYDFMIGKYKASDHTWEPEE